jgi:hypothetical protein
MTWEDAINALVTVIENPRAKKGYEGLRKYYESIGKSEYADAIKHLMEKRFGTEDTTSGEGQRENDREDP